MRTRTKLTWVAILYFAEGFPFGIVNDALPIFFRIHGIRLADIGLLSLVGLPWTLKFLWAPAVDLWGRRRTWVVACQLFLVPGLLAILAVDPSRVSAFFWAVVLGLAFFSATQDIAIDAYTIELLDEKEMGPANGVRVTAYRIALIAAGGLFVAAAGLIGWPAAFVGAAAVMALFCLLSSRLPHARPDPVTPMPATPASGAIGRAIWTPLRQFFGYPGFVFVMLFVLTFKLGDMALGPMVRPFWVDRHFTPLQIGAVPGTLGVVSTILGALLGGGLTARWGIFRALWLLGIAQAASNLVYAAAAALPPSLPLMYAASIVESFCGGLGTAPFLAFLMSICDKAHAATQYALLSALFGLTRVMAGALSGWATEEIGYAAYFTLTFFLAWPALALLPWVRRWTVTRAAGGQTSGPSA
ncbi:MAG: MFS transporter [Candidatus Methylomirabilota bacterium]|jgi:PAT family beta-lactamase induction signal transducer AmpG